MSVATAASALAALAARGRPAGERRSGGGARASASAGAGAGPRLRSRRRSRACACGREVARAGPGARARGTRGAGERARSAAAAAALAAALASTAPAPAAQASVLSAPGGGGEYAYELDAFPASLGAGDAGDSGPRADVARRRPLPTTRPARPAAKWGYREYRDAAEWALIAFVGWKAYGGRAAPSLANAAAAVGLAERPGKELAGTTLELKLDIGREKFTWMEPSWGRSGRRVEVGCAVELMADGSVEPRGVGAFSRLELERGTWSVEGDVLRFNVVLASGLDRADIYLPEGERLCFKCNAWPSARAVGSKGTLLVRRTRWLIRREWRTVGNFRAAVVEAGAPDGVGEGEGEGRRVPVSVAPAPLRMRQRFVDRDTARDARDSGSAGSP